jgi:hypothetical protein
MLAIAGFLVASAVSANAQGLVPALRCTASSGVPPLLRAEGLTELTGDIILNCTGGDPAAPRLVNFQVFLNTNITSRLYGGAYTEAILMLDEPGVPRSTPAEPITPFCASPTVDQNLAGLPPALFPTSPASPACNPATAGATYQTGTYTAFRGQKPTGAENAVVWNNIPIVPPGTTGTRIVRITNIRADANFIGASTSFVPNQVFAFISASPANSLAIDNPQQTVGYVYGSLSVDLRNCQSSGSPSSSDFQTCVAQNVDQFNDPTDVSPQAAAQFGVRFRELFASAWKDRQPNVDDRADQAGTTGFQGGESGFVPPAGAAAAAWPSTVGIADSGTKLTVRFLNIPAGLRIFVAVRNYAALTGAPPALPPARAELVSTDPNATSTGTTPIAGTTGQILCNGISFNAVEVPLTGGTGAATWNIVSQDQGATEELVFPVAIAYAANTANNLPAVGQAQFSGQYSPAYPRSNTAATRMSETLPIPRFVDTASPSNFFRTNLCVTNLLFPFVTNQFGFDTGIAISNTSRDPFSGNRRQSGPCTMYYYGRLQNGDESIITQATDRAVDSGEHLAFTLGLGGTYGLTGNPGFQGYIIAQCSFQYAHGFAFITDGPIGAARVAEGYLAVVLDEPGLFRTGQTGEGRGN